MPDPHPEQIIRNPEKLRIREKFRIHNTANMSVLYVPRVLQQLSVTANMSVLYVPSVLQQLSVAANLSVCCPQCAAAAVCGC